MWNGHRPSIAGRTGLSMPLQCWMRNRWTTENGVNQIIEFLQHSSKMCKCKTMNKTKEQPRLEPKWIDVKRSRTETEWRAGDEGPGFVWQTQSFVWWFGMKMAGLNWGRNFSIHMWRAFSLICKSRRLWITVWCGLSCAGWRLHQFSHWGGQWVCAGGGSGGVGLDMGTPIVCHFSAQLRPFNLTLLNDTVDLSQQKIFVFAQSFCLGTPHLSDAMPWIRLLTEHPHAGLIHLGFIHRRCASQRMGPVVTSPNTRKQRRTSLKRMTNHRQRCWSVCCNGYVFWTVVSRCMWFEHVLFWTV